MDFSPPGENTACISASAAHASWLMELYFCLIRGWLLAHPVAVAEWNISSSCEVNRKAALFGSQDPKHRPFLQHWSSFSVTINPNLKILSQAVQPKCLFTSSVLQCIMFPSCKVECNIIWVLCVLSVSEGSQNFFWQFFSCLSILTLAKYRELNSPTVMESKEKKRFLLSEEKTLRA